MKTLVRKFSVTISVSLLIAFTSFTQGLAEDIEIYNRTQTIPNVLFIIDTSDSMDAVVSGKTRMQHVKDALSTVMSQNYNALQVGLMDFGGDDGRGVDWPVTDINALGAGVEPLVGSRSGGNPSTETVGFTLSRMGQSYSTSGNTPTVEGLLEAAYYFRGENVYHGKARPGPWLDNNAEYDDSGSHGPSPQKRGYHGDAAGPQTYSGGFYDPTIPVRGNYCSMNPFGSGSNPPYSSCKNMWQSSVTQCNRINAKSGSTSTYNQCQGYTTTCTQYDATGSECIKTKTTCTGGYKTVTTTSGARKGYYRCHETAYGDWNGIPKYNTPINTACTANYIIMLSDGAPSEQSSSNKNNVESMVYGSSSGSPCDDLSNMGYASSINQYGECGPDLARFLATVDQSDANTGTNQPNNQFVNTFTVGISLPPGGESRNYMELLAQEGGGLYFDAQNPAQLTGTLQNIVNAILQKPRVIARFANTLDLSSLVKNRDELYVPVFSTPPTQPRWDGNIKGYTETVNGLVGLDGNAAFLANGDFNGNSRSFWSLAADGSFVVQGGVAENLNPSTRKLLTDDGIGGFTALDKNNSLIAGDPTLFGYAPTSGPSISDDDDNGGGFTPPVGTTAPPGHIDKLLDWSNGYDVFDEDGDGNVGESRGYIGDILHNDPVVAAYDGTTTDPNVGGPIDRVMFFATNEGYLHAVNVTGNTNTTGGSELWAFMPQVLLKNLDTLQANVGGDPKVYGMDGPMTYYQVGGVQNVAGKKYIYTTMRRGGNDIFGIDVTDPVNPKLMFTIDGNNGSFKEMGQTWSKPVVTNVKYNGQTTLALVIGAGYDTLQDGVTSYTADTRGRAVYIVDAVTGAKLWSAGPNSSPDTHDLDLQLDNGIASEVTVMDVDSDSIADRLYFADTGGHIHRIDLHGDLTGSAGPSNDYSGYLLADLHGTSTNDNRKFFSRPTATFTKSGKLALSFGSGNRSHPLDPAVQDRFYTIYDPNPNGVPSTAPSAITDSDLQDLTGVITGYTNTSNFGWRFDLITGEKVFNRPRILQGEVFFNTYYPPATTCSDEPDGASLYIVSLEGKPTRDLDGDTTNGNDFYATMYSFGILPEILLQTQADASIDAYFGPNSVQLVAPQPLKTKFWTNDPL